MNVLKTICTLVFIFLYTCLYSYNRTLFVDNFNNILGNPTKEDNLLKFSKKYNFSTLILYELNKVDKRLPLSEPESNKVLADFIARAKVNYGISNIGASGESADFFENQITKYNTSRTENNEKINIYNLEFEYWSVNASADGGYYCEGYLRDFNKPCNRKGSFEFFLDNLKELKALSEKESTIEIEIEAYVSYYKLEELKEISKFTDRFIVLAYGNSPKTCFSNTQSNLLKLNKVNPNIKTSILFFSTMNEMGYHLRSNSLKNSEDKFFNILNAKNKNLNEINFSGFSYHTYSFLKKAVSYYSYRKN